MRPPVKRLHGPAMRLATIHGMLDEVIDLIKAGASVESSKDAGTGEIRPLIEFRRV